MKRFIAVLVAVGFIALGSAAISFAGNGPEVIKLPAKMGTVTFPHKAHQERIADCKTCHHKGVEAGACRSCHDGTKAPKFKNAAHKRCKGCHKEKGVSTSCKTCHKK
ncbi:cytochrome c3 family protein [Geothermobacter hydrogeniphilus]|uniref:Class III cytochrome C domain-containing protein n=1 Tax=Geothermobacter hydrogeniphilus TaxID=1969733 RepID=A0A1X0Y8M3_9BACT|nr:cytochrome c3 family protein [Geothermobacter hydrogeniphilus]ORJ61560.1 hypothetical protein B5V00_05845 [Geothermobacter hydrogeniphilus]